MAGASAPSNKKEKSTFNKPVTLVINGVKSDYNKFKLLVSKDKNKFKLITHKEKDAVELALNPNKEIAAHTPSYAYIDQKEFSESIETLEIKYSYDDKANIVSDITLKINGNTIDHEDVLIKEKDNSRNINLIINDQLFNYDSFKLSMNKKQNKFKFVVK